MKFYIINAIDREYHQMGGSLRTLEGAFPSREKAQAECDSLNAEPSDVWDGHYEVAEVEVEAYATAREQAKAAKERARAATFAAFVAGCRELFDTHPDLHSFGWKQYIRYFFKESIFDFCVDRDDPDINGIDGDEVDDGQGYDEVTGKWGQVREVSIESELQDSVTIFLEEFDDEDMKALFGEEALVTVHRCGTIVNEDYFDDTIYDDTEDDDDIEDDDDDCDD